MIDDKLDKKIRLLQAKKIQEENSSYSYSQVVNDIIRKAIWDYKNISCRNSDLKCWLARLRNMSNTQRLVSDN